MKGAPRHIGYMDNIDMQSTRILHRVQGNDINCRGLGCLSHGLEGIYDVTQGQ